MMFKKIVSCMLMLSLFCSGTLMAEELDEPMPQESEIQLLVHEIQIDDTLTFPKGATIKFYVGQVCKGKSVIGDFNGDYEALKSSYADNVVTATAYLGGRYFIDCSDVTPPILGVDDPDYLYVYNVDGIGRINYADDKTQVDEDTLGLTIDGKTIRFIEKTKDYATFELPENLGEQSVAELTISDNAGNNIKLSKKIKLIPRTSYTFTILDSDYKYLKIQMNFKNPSIVRIKNAIVTTEIRVNGAFEDFAYYQGTVDQTANTVEVPFNMHVSLGPGIDESMFSFEIEVEYTSGPAEFRQERISLPIDAFGMLQASVEKSSVKLTEDGKKLLITWQGVRAPKLISSAEKYLGRITSYSITVRQESDKTTSVLTGFDELSLPLSQPVYHDSESHSMSFELPPNTNSALYTVDLEVKTDIGIVSNIELGKLAVSEKSPVTLTATPPYVISNITIGDGFPLLSKNGLVSFSTTQALLSYPFYSNVSITIKPPVEYGPLTDKEIYTATISSNIPGSAPANAEVIYGGTFAWEVSPIVDDFELRDIVINGISMKEADPEGFKYTLSTNQLIINDVFFDMDIKLVYEVKEKEAKIDLIVGKGGSVSPRTSSTTIGSQIRFTVIPDPHFAVETIKINGKTVTPTTSFDVLVEGNTKIEVSFKRVDTVLVLRINDPTMIKNDETKIELDSPPVIKNSRTLLPIRAVAEALGAQVSWNEAERKVTITSTGTRIEMWIGKNLAYTNGKHVPIDPQNKNVVPEIINGRTMVPVRFVAESLGATVSWDERTKTITIVKSLP